MTDGRSVSGQSNLTKDPIATAYGSYNRIRHVAPMWHTVPMGPHEYIHKWHLERIIRFHRVNHGRHQGRDRPHIVATSVAIARVYHCVRRSELITTIKELFVRIGSRCWWWELDFSRRRRVSVWATCRRTRWPSWMCCRLVARSYQLSRSGPAGAWWVDQSHPLFHSGPAGAWLVDQWRPLSRSGPTGAW